MAVEDVFHITGRGTVVTGRIEEGLLRVGDEVSIDGGQTVRVDGIEAFRKTVEEADTGDNVGVLFSKLERDQIARGAVLTGAGLGSSSFQPPVPPPAPAPNPFADEVPEQLLPQPHSFEGP